MIGNMCLFLGLWLLFVNYFFGPNSNRLHSLAIYLVLFGATFIFFANAFFTNVVVLD